MSGLKKFETKNGKQQVIIPIKDAVRSAKNLKENSALSLLAKLDKNGNVSDACILYLEPSVGNHSKSAAQSLSELGDKTQSAKEDGVLNVMDITGRFLAKAEYKNGKIASKGYITNQRPDSSKNATNTLFCIDWYIVTTFYNSAGEVQSVSSSYVGTTCGDCEDPSYMTLCSEGGGGGTEQPPSNSTANVDVENDEDAQDETGYEGTGPGLPDGSSAGPIYDRVKYVHTATADSYDIDNGALWVLTGISINPTTIYNPYSPLTSSDGHTGYRALSVYGHSNYWNYVSISSGHIYWNCSVVGAYSTSGSTWTKTWSHSCNTIVDAQYL